MISWFARNHVAANLLMVGAMIAGIWTLASDRIPLEVFPDMPSRMISVTVPYPASAPEEVEESIVLKIEEAIQQVGSIKHINSSASSSGGSVIIEVEEGKDPREVLDDIKIRVDAIPNLPELAEKATIQLEDNFHSVITVAIAAEMAEADLRRLGEQIRDEISALPGITHAGLSGVRPYEISIEVPEAKLCRRRRAMFPSARAAVPTRAMIMPTSSS